MTLFWVLEMKEGLLGSSQNTFVQVGLYQQKGKRRKWDFMRKSNVTYDGFYSFSQQLLDACGMLVTMILPLGHTGQAGDRHINRSRQNSVTKDSVTTVWCA